MDPTPPRRLRDRQVGMLAGRQHGAIATRQLHAIGLDDDAIGRRHEQGRLYRVHRGVYSVGTPVLTERGHWMAATLAGGQGAALSHEAAGHLWGIWKRTVRPGIDVIVPRRRRAPSGIRFHRSRTLTKHDLTTVDGIPVTTVTRTIIDLGDVLTEYQLANVLHEAEYLRLLDIDELAAAIDALCGRRAKPVARRALARNGHGSAGTRSRLEDDATPVVAAPGSHEPDLNTPIHVNGRSVEVDFSWPLERVCVEVDGPGHERIRTRTEDTERDRLLTEAGWTVLRFTAADIRNRPNWVTKHVRDALDTGARHADARETDARRSAVARKSP